MALLFIDTESDIETKRPLSIQWRYNGEHGIVTEFNFDTWKFLRSLWWSAEAIIMYNAPYDLGVLSAAFPDNLNSFKWVSKPKRQDDMSYTSGEWRMEIFGCHYKVRRIGPRRNLIENLNEISDETGRRYTENEKKHLKRPKSPPVIDLLKLWSILIDDGRNNSISLKAVAARELGVETIPFSPEVSMTDAYRFQDVDLLEPLWERFLEKVRPLPVVSGYSYNDWGKIKTPATFTKLFYSREYPALKAMRKCNEEEDKAFELSYALEHAYFGGLTISFYRGYKPYTTWFDLSGAYASCIEFLNTDRYLQYYWESIDIDDPRIYTRDVPVLCKIRSTFVIERMNQGLKLFTLDKPKPYWAWNFDIQVGSLIVPGTQATILEAYLPVGINECEESLPGAWNRLKKEEKKANGKTTLYDFYKFLSNTSYGIKAQRNPFPTNHTNLCIAGMITARVRLALLEMVDECRQAGLKWIYSDTDSVCMAADRELTPEEVITLESNINKRIAPFSAENEGFNFTTLVLSLKRYRSVNGVLLSGKPAPDKIKLHGKGIYKIDTETLTKLLGWEPFPIDVPMVMYEVAANTERTMNRLYSFPSTPPDAHRHPFAFSTDIPTDVTLREWFEDWYYHIDNKTTVPESNEEEFERYIHHFKTYADATFFFGYNCVLVDEPSEYERVYRSITTPDLSVVDINEDEDEVDNDFDDMVGEYRNWDKEVDYFFRDKK